MKEDGEDGRLNEADLRGRYDELKFELEELEKKPELSEDEEKQLEEYRRELRQVHSDFNSFYM